MIVTANRTCVLLASEDMITQRIDTHLAGAKRATVSVGKHLGDGCSETPEKVDLGGLEDVVEGFFAAASAPSPLSLDQVTLGIEVQVPEEEAMVGPGVVAFLTAQETPWQQAFSRIPRESFLQSVQGEPTTGVTCMEATYPSCTMSCSKALRASLTAYDLAMEVVKDTYFKL